LLLILLLVAGYMQSTIRQSALLVLLLVGVAVSGTDKVQNAFVDFKEIGEVQVEAEEPIGELPRLIFTDAQRGRQLTTVSVGNVDPVFFPKLSAGDDYPKLRFRVLNVAKLPDPLVLAVGMMPGGSDCGYQPVVIASVGGHITSLLRKQITFTTQDAIAFGDLGNGRGYGFAVINYLSRDDEAHYQQHYFTVEFFKWSERRGAFERVEKYTTKKKTDAIGAGIESGLPRDEIIDREKLVEWFPDFRC
jgi:hypothetical protein